MKITSLGCSLLCSTLTITAISVFGQGSEEFRNFPATRISTNALAVGGSSGFTPATGGPGYYGELLTAPASVTSVDGSLQNILSAPWSDTGLEASNSTIAGLLFSANQTVNFWPAGQTNAFVIIAWSGNLGATWSAVAPKLGGASLVSASGAFEWQGGGLSATSDGSPGFLGATTVGFRQAGGVVGDLTYPTPFLFGAGNDAQGNPVITPTTLWIVVPEPTFGSLAVVGFFACLIRTQRQRS